MRKNTNHLEDLARVPMFMACSPKELAMVARLAYEHCVEPGTVLVREGRPGHEFFVIADGTAAIVRDGAQVACLTRGDYFGELALLDRSPRNATITAVTPTRLVVIGAREFRGLLAELPTFANRLLAGMAFRLHQADAGPAGSEAMA